MEPGSNAPTSIRTAPIPNYSALLTRKEAAAYLGVSQQTLAIWKSTGRYGLPVIKIGSLAKYKQTDLDAFIASRLHLTKNESHDRRKWSSSNRCHEVTSAL